jgi:hypothetical protein
LTATDGTVSVSSQNNIFSKLPYGLVFRFKPTTNVQFIITAYIKVVHSVTNAQIISVDVDDYPPPP